MNLKKSYKILLITVLDNDCEAQSIHFDHLSGVDGRKAMSHQCKSANAEHDVRIKWATYLYLGKAKLKLKDAPAAVRYLQQAGEMNPEEPTVFYTLAAALRAEGHDEEARVALHRVSELHMTSLEADRRSHDAMVAEAR